MDKQIVVYPYDEILFIHKRNEVLIYIMTWMNLERVSQVAQWQRIHQPTQELEETRVWSLGQEGSLEEEMATHSSILAEKIQRTEELGGLHGVAKSHTRLMTEHACTNLENIILSEKLGTKGHLLYDFT